MNISESAKIGRFAADMILVAVRDLKHPDTAVEAALWLFGPDYGFYAEVAGIPFVEPLTILRKSLHKYQARNLRSRIEKIVNRYQFTEVLGTESGYSRKDVLRLADLVMDELNRIAGPRKKHGRKTRTPSQYWRIRREERNAQRNYSG